MTAKQEAGRREALLRKRGPFKACAPMDGASGTIPGGSGNEPEAGPVLG